MSARLARKSRKHAVVAAFTMVSAFCGGMTAPALGQSVIIAPQNPPPAGNAVDISGIWQREGGFTESRESRLATPPPPYKGQYLEIWTKMRAKSARGERVEDPAHECLPRGMPHNAMFQYPTELLVTPGQITMLAEYYGEVRRIFTDGRVHPPADELEPTFNGHSIGHWEGKTLVIDTVGIRTDTYLTRPGWHSEKARIIERVTMPDANRLMWATRIEDPDALNAPWEFTLKIERNSPDTNIRDFACTENLSRESYSPSTEPIIPPPVPVQ